MDKKQALKVEIADILLKNGAISQKQREKFNFETNFNHTKKDFMLSIKMFCALRDVPEEDYNKIVDILNDSRFDCLFLKSEE